MVVSFRVAIMFLRFAFQWQGSHHHNTVFRGMQASLTARCTRTQTRKVGRASKVLLRLVALRKSALGPVNGGVRQTVRKEHK